MRVTEGMIWDSGLRHLQAQVESLGQVQERIASGKRMSRPAEDPVAAGEVLDLHSNLQGVEAYDRTIELSRGWVSASDTALRNLADLVIQARTIALRGASSTNESVLPGLADEAEGVLEQAVAVANSRHGGDYLFAGFQTDTLPFALNGTTVTYRGGTDPNVDLNETMIRQVEPGHELQINVRGGALLPVLSELAALVDALGSGDVSAVAGRLAPLDDALEQITSQGSGMGLASNRIEAAGERLEDRRLEVRGLLSQLEDTDLAEASVELNSRERAYQATLATIARGSRQTLMDYLG